MEKTNGEQWKTMEKSLTPPRFRDFSCVSKNPIQTTENRRPDALHPASPPRARSARCFPRKGLGFRVFRVPSPGAAPPGSRAPKLASRFAAVPLRSGASLSPSIPCRPENPHSPSNPSGTPYFSYPHPYLSFLLGLGLGHCQA